MINETIAIGIIHILLAILAICFLIIVSCTILIMVHPIILHLQIKRAEKKARKIKEEKEKHG